MELFLLRHAQAEDSHLYSHDHQRPLSETGRREQVHIAQVLAPLLRPLDYVLSSPLIRARQTADITAAALQFSQIISRNFRTRGELHCRRCGGAPANNILPSRASSVSAMSHS